MDSVDGWSRDGTESDGVHSLWSHEEHGLRVRIASAGDGTWDLILQQRLIANRDEPGEAAERARELMENLSQD